MCTSPAVSLRSICCRVALLGLALLAACAVPTTAGVGGATAAAALPTRSVGSFEPELRCMDALLQDYGIRDLPLAVEPLSDPTHRLAGVPTGLLADAVSEMARSSHAIRLAAAASGDAAGGAADDPGRPAGSLHGTLNLADDGGTTAVLSLDVSLTGADAATVPGSATRHAAALPRQGRQFAGSAEIRQFGIAFSVTAWPANTLPQAAHALAELAAMEQVGRLARVPYWSCLGVAPTQEAVVTETQAWYDALAARPAEMIRYVQDQLRLRHAYDGPIDGAVNPQLKAAVADYREALGLAREPKISLEFFSAYLNADHRRIAARYPAAPPPATSPALASAPAPRDAPLTLQLATADPAQRLRGGDPVRFVARPSRDAYVYCFLLDEDRHVVRFFPNRYQRDARVAAASGVRLPGTMPFEIALNTRGATETVACFATERDVLARLPSAPGADNFAPLRVTALEDVRDAVRDASDGPFAQASFDLADGSPALARPARDARNLP
ncbi:MAG TPA: DUF4384 domain-containing protein [Burkholderiaceae bacterium]|nr:DUF4384 domain-containing protein [Burkholderiaceae bacterium]